MFEIQMLQKAHDRTRFDCGDDGLNQYIQRFARQNQDKDIGRTYVAVLSGQKIVCGYYTLSASSVAFDEYPENTNLPQYPVPVILLGRLAVDKQYQGQRILGADLLLHALKTAQHHSDSIGAAAVIVDALNERAQKFYGRYGFEPLRKSRLHLYLPMKKIRKLPGM